MSSFFENVADIFLMALEEVLLAVFTIVGNILVLLDVVSEYSYEFVSEDLTEEQIKNLESIQQELEENFNN